MATFFEVVTAAVNDLIEFGFDSDERLAYWVSTIRQSALEQMVPEAELDRQLRRVLQGTYERLVDQGSILQRHAGVDRYTLQRIAPRLRAELDRRIMASANLIRLNREQTIADTLRRFQGWATSIPVGGTKAANRAEIKANVRGELSSLSFRERRVLVDQGHKLNSALSEIVAVDAGALAGEWHSHWRQANYDYRLDHKDRDGLLYAVRGNWALQTGLMKPGEAGYTDQITKPGEEVFCRCYYRWLYNMRALPPAMLTVKGAEQLAAVRKRTAAA